MSGGPGPVPMPYQPSGSSGADQGWQQIFGQMMPLFQQYASQILPQYQGAVSNIMNNPYGGGAMEGANKAAQYGTGTLAPMMQGGANSLYGWAQNAQAPANQILQTGFDPQSALYNQTAGQTMDSANAINSMYGLGSSPYGAGVAGNQMNQFNLDWQNQQLGRETQAGGAYTGMMQGAEGAYGGAAELGKGAQSTIYGSGMLPYNTYMGMQQNDINALNSMSNAYGNVFNTGSSMLGDVNSYLGVGQNATSVGQAGQGQAWQQAAAPWQAGGQLLGSLLSPGGMGGGGSGGATSAASKAMGML